MATPSRRFTTTTTGPGNERPVAVLAHTKIDTLIGSIIQLDGRQSYDPEGNRLTFKWRFAQVPIGSEVEGAGFKDIRPNSTAVSFIPDKTGYYLIELVVNDGELDSLPVTASVNIQLTRVPIGENIIPDAQFLWNYISDFWKLVEDREKITSVWSSAIQVIGSDLITLWGNDYNKSLETIQATYQRRWYKVSMFTDLSDVADQRIIAGKTDSGTGGTSGNIGETPGTGNTAVFHVPYGKVGDGDHTDFTNLKGNYGAKGRVIVIDGETYTVSRVVNQNQSLLVASDLTTIASSNTVSVSSSSFEDLEDGDVLTIRSGVNAGSYLMKNITATTASLTFLNNPGTLPSFSGASGLEFEVQRRHSLVVVDETAIPEGLVAASWRVPHLLHTPGLDLEAEQVKAGDILVFEVSRKDIGLSTEVSAQIVGADRERVGFELTTQELAPLINEGYGASVIESGGVVTVSGLQNIQDISEGGYLELLNGDNPGTYRIRQVVSDDAVVIDNTLASGPDSGNPNIRWVERARTGDNVELALFEKIVQDLRIVPASAGSAAVTAAAKALIRFMPVGINLSTRPFSKFGITFKAKRIRHNSAVRVPSELISAPVLQESQINPPVVLRENLDYVVEAGALSFISGLFSVSSPSPDQFWAECAIFDNSAVVERNFGSLVNLSRDDLTQKKTRAPYLSAVKGLFFAYTNGPTLANIRLGLQILLGLPFAEERGLILEIQDEFTKDTNGMTLGRLLVEDLDDSGKRTGIRRVYFYPTVVGLEINPSTVAPYKAGDSIERFAPISKGVDVVDYIKDPLWWRRSLYGLEILKYFTFKVTVDGQIFDSNDVQFALDFVKAIKPAYTKVLTTALLGLSDDIILSDVVGGKAVLKFYDSMWGLEAASRVNDSNQQGGILWNVGSYPFHTRTLNFLTDVITQNVSGEVRATSAVGWDSTLVRGRRHDPGTYSGLEEGRLPPTEGDILVILSGQPGASEIAPGLYEIEQVISNNTLKLGWFASGVDPDQYASALVAKPPLVASTFVYGAGLKCCILRRENPTVLWEKDLVTDGSTNVVQSSLAKFLKNHVRVGDHLCVEAGPNLGEYVIDAIENTGTGASISSPSGGIATVTGLSNMTPSSVGGILEVLNGLNQGHYMIVGYTGPTSVTIRHPGALVQTGVQWRERPRAPYILEDKVALKDMSGAPVILAAGSGQSFRVVRPFLFRSVIERAQTIYDPGSTEKVLQAGYGSAVGIGLLGEWRDQFTPGQLGSVMGVSDSEQPSNDGMWLATGYINSGRVVVNTPGVNSDANPGSKVSLKGAP